MIDTEEITLYNVNTELDRWCTVEALPEETARLFDQTGLLPYLIRTFHIGFVPLVILVGYRSTHPRPSLTDLLSPM